MQLDVLNAQNQQVGTIEVRDDVFAGRVNTDLMWESVVHANAADRRGTHQTKNRANVSGSGKKPWRQKGTGRARVGEIRNPLWRKGGTVFGPQPRSYDYQLPKKIRRSALLAALVQKLNDGAVVVVDRLAVEDRKSKTTVAMLRKLGATGKTLVIDVAPDEGLALTTRNLAGVKVVRTGRVTARDVMDTTKVIVTRDAVEKLQETLA